MIISAIPQEKLADHELAKLKTDLWQGFLGVGIVMLIGGGFTWLFSSNVPREGLGLLFGFAPLIAAGGLSLFLLYHLFNQWRDIKDGHKILLEGVISEKFFKIKAQSNVSTSNASERTRYFIRVNGERFLVEPTDYHRLREGANVRLFVTPYGRTLLSVEERS